ncbi:MAG: hypothetical protein JO345_22460 [Streptosporangiaceae bacterium]|nr:hypothetical protein [Streptosporangiaceae bacterium]
MTALANSSVFWDRAAGQPGGLVRPAHPDRRDQQVENIPLVMFLNCFPIAWPAVLLLACMMPRKEPW